MTLGSALLSPKVVMNNTRHAAAHVTRDHFLTVCRQ
jgi:hypothetical protein